MKICTKVLKKIYYEPSNQILIEFVQNNSYLNSPLTFLYLSLKMLKR